MVVRDVGGRRSLVPNRNDDRRPRQVPAVSAGSDVISMTTDLNRRVASLLHEALRADDAEASGFDARNLVSDPGRAIGVLGGGSPSRVARNAVVQRFGGVGALLVIACEECWERRRSPEFSADELPDPLQSDLRRLLEMFSGLGAQEMVELVRAIESDACDSPIAATGAEPKADDEARRWLHVTYAVAARDGTDEAHRAYVGALDRVLALKRRLSFV